MKTIISIHSLFSFAKRAIYGFSVRLLEENQIQNPDDASEYNSF